MAGQRKRKHTSEDDVPSKQIKIQRGILDFATVGKPHVGDVLTKKRKTLHTQKFTTQVPPQSCEQPIENKRKRGLDSEEEEYDGKIFSTCVTQSSPLKELLQSNTATPRSKRSKLRQQPSPVETPSKDATALFDNLRLGPGTSAIPFSLGPKKQAYNTPPDTPPAIAYDADRLPSELEELLVLQAAFLSALSLYYAHNGTSSPVNVKALLPLITKNWRKRAVSLDDLRVLLGVRAGEAGFVLQDFGRGGICMTKFQPRGRGIKRVASFVDEGDLNARFEEALRKRWSEWLNVTAKEDQHVAVFMDQLPLEEITTHKSVEHTAPLFARGQQRLEDLKASQAAANSPQDKPCRITADQKTDTVLQNRGTSLLDRILAKQAHAAALPAGPTRKQLERKAALHRIEDIERVLDLLAAGRTRCSFSMPIMIQQLQQSLRNPISKEEVHKCLELMAAEITPGFVKLIRTGAVTGVVVTKGGKVGLEQLRQRVASAGA